VSAGSFDCLEWCKEWAALEDGDSAEVPVAYEGIECRAVDSQRWPLPKGRS